MPRLCELVITRLEQLQPWEVDLSLGGSKGHTSQISVVVNMEVSKYEGAERVRVMLKKEKGGKVWGKIRKGGYVPEKNENISHHLFVFVDTHDARSSSS